MARSSAATKRKRTRAKSSDAAAGAAVPPLPDDLQDRLDAGLAERREWLADVEGEAQRQAPFHAKREADKSAAETNLRERSNARINAALPEIAAIARERGNAESVDLFPFACSEIPIDDPRHKLLLEELQKRRDEADAWFPATPIQSAWEGLSPDGPIRTQDDLRAYAAGELASLTCFYQTQGRVTAPAFESACAAIRNIHRLLDVLHIRHRPAWPAEPANATDAERQLSNLLIWFNGESSEESGIGRASASAVGKSSSSDLAAKHGVDADRLRKRLDRWRHDHDSGYIEATTRKPHDPRFLYDEAAVLPVIDALKTSGQRPAKKI